MAVRDTLGIPCVPGRGGSAGRPAPHRWRISALTLPMISTVLVKDGEVQVSTSVRADRLAPARPV